MRKYIINYIDKNGLKAKKIIRGISSRQAEKWVEKNMKDCEMTQIKK